MQFKKPPLSFSGLSQRAQTLFADELFQTCTTRQKVFMLFLETCRNPDGFKEWPDLYVRDILSTRRGYLRRRAVPELRQALSELGLPVAQSKPGIFRYHIDGLGLNQQPPGMYADSMFKRYPLMCKRLQGVKSQQYELPDGLTDVPLLEGREIRTTELLRVADNPVEQLILMMFKYFHYRENIKRWGLGNVWLFDPVQLAPLLGVSHYSIVKAVRDLVADGRMIRLHYRPTVLAMTAFGLATTSAVIDNGSVTLEARQSLPAKTVDKVTGRTIHIRRGPQQ